MNSNNEKVSKDMRSNCFNNILTALNITDSLHIVFAILEVLHIFSLIQTSKREVRLFEGMCLSVCLFVSNTFVSEMERENDNLIQPHVHQSPAAKRPHRLLFFK